MAHIRKRQIVDDLIKTLAFSPIVGVLGHRQVGKTTLLESFSEDYFAFDDQDTYIKRVIDRQDYYTRATAILDFGVIR